MQLKISVIIPIYNSEKYISRCIDSLLTQSFKDIEIILVNDGSIDNTASIIDNYAQKHSAIKAFHNQNMGAGSSREFGVSKASGEWVTFVDSDDTLPTTALEQLIKKDNGKYDIISGIYFNKYDGSYFTHKKDGELTNVEYIAALLNGETIDGPCAKIIKRELFSKYKINTPKNIKQNEDMLMLINLAKNVDYVLMCNDIVSYNYIYRGDSARSTCMPLDSWIKLFTYIKEALSTTTESYEVRKAFAKYRVKRMKYFNQWGYILGRKENYRMEMLSDIAEFKDDSEIKRYLLFLKHPCLQVLDYRYTKTKKQTKYFIKKYILRRPVICRDAQDDLMAHKSP